MKSIEHVIKMAVAQTITKRKMQILDANSAWFGTPVIELMETAGQGIAAQASKLGESFVIICGPGNNGGDGFAAARYLKSKPKIYYFWPPKTNEAHENFVKAKNYRPIQIDEKNLASLAKDISESDVIIDAMFGTGLKGKIREPIRSVIEIINNSKKKVLSVDIPSGIDPDTAKIDDISVNADITVALHAIKEKVKSKKVSGKTVLVDIGIHPKSETHVGKGDFKFNFLQRKEKSKKGDSGKVLVVGGSQNYTGAPYFAAVAALKAGCDLSYVTAPKEPAERIAILSPDLIVHPLKSEYKISNQDIKQILSIKCDVLCIGNGLGDDPKSLDAAREIVIRIKKPMVIDGDALKAVKPILSKLTKDTILLPHAGEFKQLFGLSANERNLKKVAAKYKCAIVLKGSTDIICQKTLPNKINVKYNDSGNPYMAKGGTGDILAGLCAGYLAQKIDPFDAACYGALVNGVSGDISYSEKGIAMLASDVLDCVSLAQMTLLS